MPRIYPPGSSRRKVYHCVPLFEKKCSKCIWSFALSEFIDNKGKQTVMCTTCRVKGVKYRVIQRERARAKNAVICETDMKACTRCSVMKYFHNNFVDEKTGKEYKLCVECRKKDSDLHASHMKRAREVNATRSDGMKACTKCFKIQVIDKFNDTAGQEHVQCNECRTKFSIHKRTTISGKITVYKAAAKKQHILWALDEERCATLFQGDCTYCCTSVSENGRLSGIDRMNSGGDYVESNVVTCCWRCNESKCTVDPFTFIERCLHIHGTKRYDNAWTVKTPGTYSGYKNDANRRGYTFEMTREQYDTFLETPCIYCKREITDTNKSGIDRRDSTKGYIEGNMDPCCTECNYMKGTMSVDAFRDMVSRIAKNVDAILPKIPPDIPRCFESFMQFRKVLKQKRSIGF